MQRALILVAGAGSVTGLGSAALAQQWEWQREGVLPRHATPEELSRPWTPSAEAPVTPPPVGPIHTPAEYEPMEGLQMSYRGSGLWNAILVDMTKRITTGGHGKVFMVYQANVTPLASVQNALTAAGANLAFVEFIPATLDAIWCRDYGPRHSYQGGNVRVVQDHRYNRNRPNDDNLPVVFASVKNRARYEPQLNHGGGNYHLNALSKGYASHLIVNENIAPVLGQPWVTWVYTEPQIIDIWQDYWHVDTHVFDQFPTSVDATGHIDMWMQVIAADRVVISDWPNNVGSLQDNICDAATVYMQSQGYTVYRVPAFSISGVHYTFTNMVMINNLVMVPSYTHATVAPFNASALATIQTALDGSGKVAESIPCQNIISAAGAVHCIVMHIPKFLGPPGQFWGLAPTAYLTSPIGGETVTGGSIVDITWVSDDDEATATLDLRLSTDGGATFPTVIASATADDRHFAWTVPNTPTTQARVRVVVSDHWGNTGSDDSDSNFTIEAGCYADCNQSGGLTIADFTCFQAKFVAGDPYADCNQSGGLSIADFTCFQGQFVAGCP